MNSRYKYPSTPHLPFSQGLQNDDRKIQSLNGFVGREIVVTEKMDGENTTLYSDHTHARSLDSRNHESRNWVKGFWSTFMYQIPTNWRVCGENVYAEHSIGYDDLDTYFYCFSVWNDQNVAISWDDTLTWFKTLGITPVKELYRGSFDLKQLQQLADSLDTEKVEGYVIRVTDAVPFDDFDKKFAKWVRKGHVQTTEHWMTAKIVPNRLRKNV